MTKGQRLIQIKAALNSRQDAVEKALLLIYGYQTPDEKSMQATVEKNGLGFNAFDAGILTSYAEYILENRWNRPRGFVLTERQLAVARRKIVRYVGQLVPLAEAKEARRATS